jgi:flagellar assembly factor FliW
MSVATLSQSLVGCEIVFPDGLPGFPAAHRFTLQDLGVEMAPFMALECLDEGLRFIVVPPGALWPSYTLELPDEVAAGLGLETEADAAILAIVTIRPAPEPPTANLMGPLVINVLTANATQFVLQPNDANPAHPVTAAYSSRP